MLATIAMTLRCSHGALVRGSAWPPSAATGSKTAAAVTSWASTICGGLRPRSAILTQRKPDPHSTASAAKRSRLAELMTPSPATGGGPPSTARGSPWSPRRRRSRAAAACRARPRGRGWCRTCDARPAPARRGRPPRRARRAWPRSARGRRASRPVASARAPAWAPPALRDDLAAVLLAALQLAEPCVAGGRVERELGRIEHEVVLRVTRYRKFRERRSGPAHRVLRLAPVAKP